MLPVVKQYVGDFVTTTGFEVHMRDMGTYNDTLFGDVLSDLNLQSNDVLLVSSMPLNWALLCNVNVACNVVKILKDFNRHVGLPCWQCYPQARTQIVKSRSCKPSWGCQVPPGVPLQVAQALLTWSAKGRSLCLSAWVHANTILKWLCVCLLRSTGEPGTRALHGIRMR